MQLTARRKAGELAQTISAMTVASSGDKKVIKEVIKRLEEEGQ